MEVVAPTPAGGLLMPLDRIPAHVQVLDAARLRAPGAVGLPDGLTRGLGGVHPSNLGGNPLQPDLLYRGFRASPLLGAPQGLAVYLDGVRVNEPFGDVVNWDLIPDAVVARVTAMPGSNPVFGLNALGGAIAAETKDGLAYSGRRLEASTGSYGWVAGEVEAGGPTGRVLGARTGLYGSASAFREQGWRDFSPSAALDAFAKLTVAARASRIDVSGLAVTSGLRGNGAVPVSLLDERRAAVFTHPDRTSNRLAMWTVRFEHAWGSSMALTAVGYGRHLGTDTFNGDDSDYGYCPNDPHYLCAEVEDDEEGEARKVLDQQGRPVPYSDAVSTATNNRTRTGQSALGASFQVRLSPPFFGRMNHLVVGAAVDGGRVRFDANTELARLTPSRGTEGSGLYDAEAFTSVDAHSNTAGVFLLDAFRLTDAITVTLGGRYSRTRVVLQDRIGTALDGDHTFGRFNPSAGVTYASSGLVLHAGVGLTHRAPTPVELTCADPGDPCRLPNGFQSDPPLQAPVAMTVAAGARGRRPGPVILSWSAGAFLTDTNKDIVFISAGPARNSGYFDNVGRTRRVGVEALGRVEVGAQEAFIAVTVLQATFEDRLTMSSPHHPLAEEGEIEVSPGDRLPLTAPLLITAGSDLQLPFRLTAGADVQVVGRQHVRGDEANLLRPLSAYGVLNVRAGWRARRGVEAFADLRNVLNTHYETAGILGDVEDVFGSEDLSAPGQDEDDGGGRFLTPGPPRTIRLGVSIAF